MTVENAVGSLPGVELEATGETPSVVASNIERWLNNHIREGGHAWQMNMAARPAKWHPLPQGAPPKSTGRP
jgi:hypothetical protein